MADVKTPHRPNNGKFLGAISGTISMENKPALEGLFSGARFVFKKASNYTVPRVELMVLNTLPMRGPRIIRAAITTMDTKTIIRAYSTRPWPFSLRAKNMVYFFPFIWFSPNRWR
jgi:hypothetical protein